MVKKNSLPIEVIGSVEYINLIEQNIANIPARVDTGAIFSSIWASEVQVRKGVLSFKLFAPGSALHTGEVIKTDKFRTASVKNSFGHSEFRYKVLLMAAIGDRKIRAWFTLADRSGMTYPVLIGRNILRNKFVVDVSKHRTQSKSSPSQVLVLASQAKDFEEFFGGVEKLSKTGARYTLRDYKDLVFSIKPGRVSVIESITGRDIGEFDLAYFKSHKRDYAKAVAAAQYLQFRGIKVVDKEITTHISYDKLSEYMRLGLHNLPVPTTFCATNEYLLKNIDTIAEEIGWPLVFKEIEADRGMKNYVLDDKQELLKAAKATDPKDIYVIQRYIPNDGFIRTLVFDRAVLLAIHRAPIERADKDKTKRHLNKMAYSDNVTLMKLTDLDPRVHDLSVRASVTMNRQVAGVDILQDLESKEWFILEVNNSPQLKAGPFAEERKMALAKFIDQEITG